MRKEIIFAIIFGGILGLIVAFGIWRVNSALSPKETQKEAASSPTPKPDFLISLAKPQNNDVLTETPSEISGITKTNALVSVSGEGADYITNAAGDGTFGQKVSLVGGVNQVVLTAFDESGSSTQTNLLVVFSSEFGKIIENLSTPTPATNEADSVREKVQEKVTEALNKPRAYLGTITDISETTIQLKSAEGEILQVATEEGTVYVKTDPSAKTVSFKDLAIGDFIVAMGFRNGNSVLNAKRILITPALAQVKRQALLGKIVKTSTKDFVLRQSANNQETTILPDKTTLYFARSQDKIVKSKFADLKEGAEIVVFGTSSEKGFVPRSVFIVAVGS